ncbi:MAG: GTPase Era [Gemmatimonadota bacterium]|nr:GTPase Era [Gemmatimonadota bacterium]
MSVTDAAPPEAGSDGGGPGFRAGFVALIGLPNVGKSTLLNALVGERLSIVTPKAQTTRRKHLGIYSDDGHQAVFIDTPGLLEPRYTLQRSMREEALSALDDADVVVAIVDAGYEPSIDWVSEFSPAIESPKLLCINKCDRVSEGDVDVIEARTADAGWVGVVRTTGTRGEGVEALREAILAELPESPPYYPVDELSDAPVRDFVAEMVRETCLEELSQEVPYSVAVQIEQFRERAGGRPTYIEAVIFVERESQKGIVVGKGGATIRRIGSRSREKIERFLDHAVYLELRVKVLANWRKRADRLRVLGFRVPTEEA